MRNTFTMRDCLDWDDLLLVQQLNLLKHGYTKLSQIDLNTFMITFHSTPGVHRTAQAFCVPPTAATQSSPECIRAPGSGKGNIGYGRK